MPDTVRLITRRIATMTYQIVDSKAQFLWGTVLSRNADGTLNVDDGRGGCVLVVPPTNARTGERVFVNLGDTIKGIGMPGVATYAAPVPQINHGPAPVFIDNAGNIYSDTTGALTGSGGTPTADVDHAFGYSFDTTDPDDNLSYAGVSPSYNTLLIGHVKTAGSSGYQGETYSANNTVLCQGLGGSAGILLGIEALNVDPGTAATVWTVNIRDATTFAILTTNSATYISGWMTAHSADYPGDDTSWDVHVSPDPLDGSFWVNIGGNTGTATAPMFNVALDGSLIKTITLDTSGYSFFRRAHRVQP